MRATFPIAFFCAWTLVAATVAAQSTRLDPPIVPAPRVVEAHGDEVLLSELPTIAAAHAALLPTAEALAETWWRMTGQASEVVLGTVGDVVLRLDPELSTPEAHVVRVARGDDAGDAEDAGNASVAGATVAAVARGAATLLQVADSTERGWTLPTMTVRDEPASSFRAVMVDVARQPHSVRTLEHVIDLLFLYKVRYLHLHLTDDQAFTFPFAPVTDALPDNRTIPIEDWRELVAYGEARGVTILPELDLPGHSTQLKQSGYLDDPTPEDPLTDRDIAHPINHARICAIVDAMIEVFEPSPYFHIGGDESGAGETLVPFLAAINTHLRAKAPEDRRRLMVWEGFHGAPPELPATGDDRIVVFGWESSYNPPWSLLDAGYEVVNASWKPLYVVGGGTYRYPHIGGRYWSPRVIHAWGKDEFWHWQPGTPVFEDRGPADDDRTDGIWHVPEGQRHQVIGGELLFWEQREETVLTEAFDRVAALSDRLWNHQATDAVGFDRRHDAVRERVRSLVQPVRMTLVGDFDPEHPTARDHHWFDGAVQVRCESPGALGGEVRITRDGSAPTVDSERVEAGLSITEDTRLVAQLFVGGDPVGAPVRANFDRRPARVRVSWFDLPRRALSHVPDFADADRWTPIRVDLLPELRGPYRTVEPVGQMLEGDLVVEEEGAYTFRLQTRDGRAKLYVDDRLLLGPSDPSEEKLFATVDLTAGPHRVRVDHASGDISPVVIAAVQGPGEDRFTDITQRLAEIPRGTEPESLGPLRREVDLLARGLADWRFVTESDATLDDVVELTPEGVVRIAGRPSGYLQTTRWYRDYELEFEWRWPNAERPGNSGLLVHVTTPLLFYGWPRSLEVQLQHGRAGDFWTIGAGVDVLVEDTAERRTPRRPGDLHTHRRLPRRIDDLERPAGDWNHMRVRADGDTLVVSVNGVEVNRGLDCTETAGAIAFQSEGAAIEIRGVRLRPLEYVQR